MKPYSLALYDAFTDIAFGGREDLIDQVDFLFVPVFNLDGHERRSPWNRPNQRGPVNQGWRTTAQNLNLNRDYLKADTPEMRAWLRLFQAWLPDFFMYIHSTDGADNQYPITYGLELNGNMDSDLTAWTSDYRDAMVLAMEDDGYALGPYVSFRSWHDPESGLKGALIQERFKPSMYGW